MPWSRSEEAGLLSSEDSGQEAPHSDGPPRRPPGRRPGACCSTRVAAGAVPAAVVCTVVAALRLSGPGGRAREGGPAGAAAGSVLSGWDTEIRLLPRLDQSTTTTTTTTNTATTTTTTTTTTGRHQAGFDGQDFFDELARNWNRTGRPPRHRRPTVFDEMARIGNHTGRLPGPKAVARHAPSVRREPPRPPAALWPLRGKTLLLIGQDNDNIEGYVDAFGAPPGFSVYVNIDDVASGLLGPGEWGAGTVCAECLLKEHGKGVAFNLAVDIVDSVHDVVAGAWDDNIKRVAAWVKTTGGPVYMRPGYEFDGGWNHFEPEAYRLAYVRFVELFRDANVTNVLWVWHSGIALPTFEGRDRMEWYPGDDYVDLFGASVFTALYADGHPYKSHFLQKMEDLQDWAQQATARDKPLVIVESTPRTYEMTHPKAMSAWTSWFQPMFEFIKENDVRLFAYINCYWDNQSMWRGRSWGDTRLQASQPLTAWWMEEMDKARWKNVFGESGTDRGRAFPDAGAA